MGMPEQQQQQQDAAPFKAYEGLEDDLFASLRRGDMSLLKKALSGDKESQQLVKSASDADGRSLLHAAAAADLADACKLLIEAQSDWTALHVVAAAGCLKAARVLLQCVSEPKKKQSFIEAVNESGSRALHYAASKGHLPLVELLIREGADGNAKAFGNHTPLTRAVSAGKEEIVQYLLSVPGVDLQVRETKSGDNLLHIAVNSERADIYWDIARVAPDLEDATNADGKTPVGMASHDFMKRLEFVIKHSRQGDEG
ncbi:hypothetical protein Esti_006344 [Eimeria stiedai]